MTILFYTITCLFWICIKAYSNQLFTISKPDDNKARSCIPFNTADARSGIQGVTNNNTSAAKNDGPFDIDPFDIMQNDLHEFLYGMGDDIEMDVKDEEKWKLIYGNRNQSNDLQQTAKGNALRSELFQDKSAVHITAAELVHRGFFVLNITSDYMQTAVNAFSIFLYGTIKDIERLPADYVLRSTRTISMMKIAREKLVATWDVVKAHMETNEVTYETLELYRPLFKYINGREMARLNLSDERILAYIGTHVDLNRHQVGIIASKYIANNKRWAEPRSLNLMNNLLCGVPIVLMRKVPESTYLQLSHQVFYHVRACDPLQRRFYLTMMSKTQALGKSNSWNARDVSRLGLLLAEVDGNDLASINPKAMSGITAEVMSKMAAHNLKYLTRPQLENIGQKPLNILAKKLGVYQELLDRSSSERAAKSDICFAVIFLVCIFIKIC